MKYFYTLIAGILLNILTAQTSFFSNPITGTNPNTSNPYNSGQTVNAYFTASGIGRSSGINGANANDRYNANNWSTSSNLDNNDYFEWTISPVTNVIDLDLADLDITLQRSNTGPTTFEIRTSVDGFANAVGGVQTLTGSGSPGSNFTIDLSSITNLGNDPLIFRLYAYSAGGSTGTFSVNDFDFSYQTIVLPVKLSSFDVKNYNGAAKISWTTESEFNNHYFILEHSLDGKNFTPISKADGNGTSNTKNSYEVIHETFSYYNIYRLSQVDFDGSKETFPTQEFYLEKNKEVKLYPTITNNFIFVEYLSSDDEIKLFDSIGRLVLSSNESKIDLSNLKAGIYFAKTNNKNFKIYKI